MSPYLSSRSPSRDPANQLFASTSSKSAAALVGGVAAFAAGGSAEDISTAGMVSSSAIAYNRELHPKELLILRKAQEGKSAEEKERLEMAAHARIHSSSGVPGDDAEKPQLLAKDTKGASYSRESAILDDTARKLGVSGAFEYTEMHSIDDALSRGYDHILTRGGGALSLVSGSVGVVSMGGLAAASSLSTTAGNPYAIAGSVFAGALGLSSYTHAVRGSDRLFGMYESDLGARVERSFLEPVGSSYSGRMLERAATEAGVALGSIAAFRALPVIDGAVSGAVSRGGGGSKMASGAGAGASSSVAKAEVASGVVKEGLIPTATPFPTEYWTRSVEFRGNKVYQRNDLIDPLAIHPKYGISNLEAMKKGYAPIGPDNKSINLHHTIQNEKGAIAEVTETFHRDNSKVIHINPSTTESGISRTRFDAWREKYWVERAKDFE